MLQLGYQYLVYDNPGLCCIAFRLAIYILWIPFSVVHDHRLSVRLWSLPWWGEWVELQQERSSDIGKWIRILQDWTVKLNYWRRSLVWLWFPWLFWSLGIWEVALIVVLWSEVLWIMDEFDRLSWWYNDADLVEVVAVSLEGSGGF